MYSDYLRNLIFSSVFFCSNILLTPSLASSISENSKLNATTCSVFLRLNTEVVLNRREFDLLDKDEALIFSTYLRNYFGDPNTNLPGDAFERVGKLLRDHPELLKETFPDLMISPEVPNTHLASFHRTHNKALGHLRVLFTKPEAQKGKFSNLSYKIKEQNKKKKIIRSVWQEGEFEEFWDQFLDASNINGLERFERQARLLVEQRKKLRQRGGHTRSIDQMIIDLCYFSAAESPAIKDVINTGTPSGQYQALSEVKNVFNTFFKKTGLGDDVFDFMRAQQIGSVSGLSSFRKNEDSLKKIEKELHDSVKAKSEKKRLRHLTTTESSFRSCIGGSDCSSRTYLTKALDPNYHYFTLTDASGRSNGHMTVVLGHNPDGKKVAVVDKFMNVPENEMRAMTEAVRRSLKTKGYTLAFLEDPDEMLGSGLTNADSKHLLSFMQFEAAPKGNRSLGKFTTRDHGLDLGLEEAFTRASKGFSAREVSANPGLSIQKVDPNLDNTFPPVTSKEVVKELTRLAQGSYAEKLSFYILAQNFDGLKIREMALEVARGLVQDESLEIGIKVKLLKASEKVFDNHEVEEMKKISNFKILFELADEDLRRTYFFDRFNSPSALSSVYYNIFQTDEELLTIFWKQFGIDKNEIARLGVVKVIEGPVFDKFREKQLPHLTYCIKDILDEDQTIEIAKWGVRNQDDPRKLAFSLNFFPRRRDQKDLTLKMMSDIKDETFYRYAETGIEDVLGNDIAGYDSKWYSPLDRFYQTVAYWDKPRIKRLLTNDDIPISTRAKLAMKSGSLSSSKNYRILGLPHKLVEDLWKEGLKYIDPRMGSEMAERGYTILGSGGKHPYDAAISKAFKDPNLSLELKYRYLYWYQIGNNISEDFTHSVVNRGQASADFIHKLFLSLTAEQQASYYKFKQEVEKAQSKLN